MLSVMAIHGFRGNIKENNLKNSTLNMLKIQPYIDAIALFLRNKALSYMAPGEERHDNQYPNTYGLCCLHRTVDMADGGYFLHTVILKPLISNTITPMQLLRRMPKWMGTRPMHVATRSVSNPNTPVKRKTSAKRKKIIPISNFLYGSFVNSSANCFPMYFVMKNENAAAINTAINKYINDNGGISISQA
jgi:hypothetical protein